MATKNVIIIAGPTAVGKTNVAIEIATHFGTEIISADSRQCYNELKIGVARPSEEQLAEVKHHFIASHSIHQKINAATFEQYALEKAEEIFQHHDIAVMVGGTGLYLKSFCEGLDAIPGVPETIHNEIISAYKTNGLQWLQEQVLKTDPKFYEEGEIQNPHRLIRALGVYKATGTSIISFKKHIKAKRDFNIIKIALELPKEQLHMNISNRTDQMISNGLVSEVQSLLPYKQLNALNTVGYKEIFDHFAGNMTLDNATEEIKKHTRQYAKRQLTWFKKDQEYKWFPPLSKPIIPYLNEATS